MVAPTGIEPLPCGPGRSRALTKTLILSGFRRFALPTGSDQYRGDSAALWQICDTIGALNPLLQLLPIEDQGRRPHVVGRGTLLTKQSQSSAFTQSASPAGFVPNLRAIGLSNQLLSDASDCLLTLDWIARHE